MSTMWMHISQNELNPTSRCRRVSSSWPHTCSTQGIRAINSTWISNKSAARSPVSRPRAVIVALGRLTGLLAADLLLIQVLLMARIPWVEQVWGQDELTRRHRLVGFTSFWLMCVHVVLVTLGYAQTSHTDLVAQGW